MRDFACVMTQAVLAKFVLEALYFKEFEIQCFCVLAGVNGLMLFFNRISC